MPPQASYAFKHALVRDAAYGTLLRGRRKELHGNIAQGLESGFPEIVETQPDLLAQHCAEAGLVENAVAYWLKAGQLHGNIAQGLESGFREIVETQPDLLAHVERWSRRLPSCAKDFTCIPA